jgi:hypothetical protein
VGRGTFEYGFFLVVFGCGVVLDGDSAAAGVVVPADVVEPHIGILHLRYFLESLRETALGQPVAVQSTRHYGLVLCHIHPALRSNNIVTINNNEKGFTVPTCFCHPPTPQTEIRVDEGVEGDDGEVCGGGSVWVIINRSNMNLPLIINRNMKSNDRKHYSYEQMTPPVE